MPEEQKAGFVLLSTQYELKLMANDQKCVGTYYYDKYNFESCQSSYRLAIEIMNHVNKTSNNENRLITCNDAGTLHFQL